MPNLRKKCFTWKTKMGTFKWCITWFQLATWYLPAYPKVPGPDTGPMIEVEGIDGKLQKELELLAVIDGYSEFLSAGTAKLIREAVSEGMKGVQHALPSASSLHVE